MGIKYVCGKRCFWSHWDETLLTGDQVEKLRDLCDKHLGDWKKYCGEVEKETEKIFGNLGKVVCSKCVLDMGRENG